MRKDIERSDTAKRNPIQRAPARNLSITTEVIIMSMRNWLRANQQKLKWTKGAEDIAGRRLLGDMYDLPGMSRPFKPRPSKEELRELANKAIADWNGRALHSGLTAASS